MQVTSSSGKVSTHHNPILDLSCLIQQAVNRVEEAVRTEGYAGFDKYSLRDTALSRRIFEGGGFFRRILHRPYNFVLNYFPGILLKVTNPPKLIHAKAMGLFADAYLDRYRATGDDRYKELAHDCMEWLLKNTAPGYPLYCWGVPFDWKTKGRSIPANTPIASVSSICLDSFWRWENYLHDHMYRDMPVKVCSSLLKSLYRHMHLPEDMACYGYTAGDRFRVINGNLFIAEKLLLVGKHFDREDELNEGKRIVRYCLSNTNADGTFPYQGHELGVVGKAVDAYHNGFILRSLFRIHRMCPSEEIEEVLRCGLDAYLKNFLGPNGETWVQPEKRIIDIHGCAETILCLGRLMTIFPDCREQWERSIRWTIEHMQNRATGHFFYRRINISSFAHWTVDVPYIRWSDAWMYKALAESLLILKDGGVDW